MQRPSWQTSAQNDQTYGIPGFCVSCGAQHTANSVDFSQVTSRDQNGRLVRESSLELQAALEFAASHCSIGNNTLEVLVNNITMIQKAAVLAAARVTLDQNKI